jgi:hypothetical protein
VPIGGESIEARILAHGRDDDTVAKSNFADSERRE